MIRKSEQAGSQDEVRLISHHGWDGWVYTSYANSSFIQVDCCYRTCSGLKTCLPAATEEQKREGYLWT